MSAKYIIRMDDACPCMNKSKWDQIENILDLYKIKPIVAVIPNNEDSSLNFSEFDNNFWNRVKDWKSKRWEIALHGYNHVYNSKGKSIVPIKNVSEFSGLSLEMQKSKIKNAIEIFRQNNIEPRVFVAPGHAFDINTIKALIDQTKIEIISDGFFYRAVSYLDINWIPQQLWTPRNMPYGLWTICLHPNNMTTKDFGIFEKFIKKNTNNIISVEDIKMYKKANYKDHLFFNLFNLLVRVKKHVNS